MGYLKLEEALQVQGRKFEDLEVPELKGTLRLAELTAGRSLEFKKLQARRDKGEDVEGKQMVMLLTGAVVDEAGKPIFNDKTASAFIDAVSFNTLQLIVNKVLQMMTPPEKKKPEGGEEKSEGEAEPSGN